MVRCPTAAAHWSASAARRSAASPASASDRRSWPRRSGSARESAPLPVTRIESICLPLSLSVPASSRGLLACCLAPAIFAFSAAFSRSFAAVGGGRPCPVCRCFSSMASLIRSRRPRPERVQRMRLRHGRIASNQPPLRRCSSSVVEHSLGKGEVESSILSCSTSPRTLIPPTAQARQPSQGKTDAAGSAPSGPVATWANALAPPTRSETIVNCSLSGDAAIWSSSSPGHAPSCHRQPLRRTWPGAGVSSWSNSLTQASPGGSPDVAFRRATAARSRQPRSTAPVRPQRCQHRSSPLRPCQVRTTASTPAPPRPARSLPELHRHAFATPPSASRCSIGPFIGFNLPRVVAAR